MTKRKFRMMVQWSVGALLLVLGLSGCAKTASSNTNTAITYVSVMNTATYSPATDIYFNGIKLTKAPIPPVNYSRSYYGLPPNLYDVQYKAGNTDSLMADIPSSRYDSALFYTLVLYNDAVGGPAKAVKIVDNFSSVSLSSSNYRFFNFCPSVASVDLYFNSTNVQTARTVADNVSNTSYNAFQPVTPGIYNIVAKVAGRDSTVATLSSVGLASQYIYTIFLTGQPGNATNPVALSILQASY